MPTMRRTPRDRRAPRGGPARAAHVENRAGAVRHLRREIVAHGRVHGSVTVHVGSGIDRRRQAPPRRLAGNVAKRQMRREAPRGPSAARRRSGTRATSPGGALRPKPRRRRRLPRAASASGRRREARSGLPRIRPRSRPAGREPDPGAPRGTARDGDPARAAGRPPGRPARERSAHPPRRRKRRGRDPGARRAAAREDGGRSGPRDARPTRLRPGSGERRRERGRTRPPKGPSGRLHQHRRRFAAADADRRDAALLAALAAARG